MTPQGTPPATPQAAPHSTPAPVSSSFLYMPDRTQAIVLGALASLAFIAFGTLIFPATLARILLDYPSKHFLYPFTMQNIMHVLFFVALGDLFVRWRVGVRETSFLHQRYLPEDDQTVLRVKDLGPIRRRVIGQFDREHGILPSLIDLSILQFQSSHSVDQAASVMNSALQLTAHRVDMRYGMVRFIAWLVPTLGFIGTVYGLGAALMEAGENKGGLDLKEVARTLGIGFDATMTALMQSAVLVFVLQMVQAKEESAVNHAGEYTLRNLINRLYVERKS